MSKHKADIMCSTTVVVLIPRYSDADTNIRFLGHLGINYRQSQLADVISTGRQRQTERHNSTKQRVRLRREGINSDKQSSLRQASEPS